MPAGSRPAACMAARMLMPSASFCSSHFGAKLPVSAEADKKVAAKRWPSSSENATTSIPKGRRRPAWCSACTQASGTKIPSRPSYLPPLRTVS